MDRVQSRWTQTLLLLIAVPLWVMTLRPLLAPAPANAQVPAPALLGASRPGSGDNIGRYQLVVTPPALKDKESVGSKEYVVDTATGHVWTYYRNPVSGSGYWVDMKTAPAY